MDIPAGLGERGMALWTSLGQVESTAAGAIALEACRAADRLDELDNIIQGKGVLNLMQFRVLNREKSDDDLNINVKVEFSSVLAEARQQQLALRQLLASALVSAPAKPAEKPETKGSALDELAARRSGSASSRRATK